MLDSGGVRQGLLLFGPLTRIPGRDAGLFFFLE